MKNRFQRYFTSLIKSLQKVDPYQIFVFGSAAHGNFSEDSDIDIAVILDTNYEHTSYDEKLETRARVRDSILDISFEVPIDLLVYSKSEFYKLKEENPGFMKEIVERGKLLYEKPHS
ncbi:MAG TPA: nucleotidyltransferase domain-containing protein [Spirochaetia bacterium]|nr:nucleotidyltransferase domain-containing protein [Spirochaetia bacterium]